jgi:integron integrase
MAEPRLLDRVRAAVRLKHYSLRTEQAYTRWVERYVRFHDLRHPAEMGAAEIRGFLSHLATRGRVSASTQNQARAALLFLYRVVLELELQPLGEVVRARRPRRMPVVLTRNEVQAVLAQLGGDHRLVAGLLYGSGLRLLEALRLRVKDLDFELHQVTVRDGKGQKDRVSMLPRQLVAPFHEHIARVRHRHDRDLRLGGGEVYLPGAYARKNPSAARSWG